ncbi:hypothetical protein [Pseudarthrobacter sp. fls2-241-R2A-127]|uniref:hypothetical protein n=1 Tax=Pseudarthrobacter sp. fls2-241-R2A-127 TaxID=3040303 RepID=UPI0025527320|nr:hypothetical protein [Pseudarthrobacter sp. fls2-241-R2A-127]
MALFKETDVSLAVDSDEPHTQKRELASAIEIAELEAGLLGGAGVRIIQHDYWSFSVTPTFDVPFGQKEERREWLALAETARTVAGMGDARSNTMQ